MKYSLQVKLEMLPSNKWILTSPWHSPVSLAPTSYFSCCIHIGWPSTETDPPGVINWKLMSGEWQSVSKQRNTVGTSTLLTKDFSWCSAFCHQLSSPGDNKQVGPIWISLSCLLLYLWLSLSYLIFCVFFFFLSSIK